MTRAQLLLGRTFRMVCAEQSTTWDYPGSTVTTRDPPSGNRTALRNAANSTEDLAEEPYELQEEQEESAKPHNNQMGAATSMEDLAEEPYELQEDHWDTETLTVRERKKRAETPSESPQSEEEVPKSSPGGQKGTGNSSQSSQEDAEAESESSKGFWGKFKRFWKSHSGRLSIFVTVLFTVLDLLVKFL